MERDVYVEMYNNEGKRILNQEIPGIRIFGGMTIYYPEKSLRFINEIFMVILDSINIFNSGEKKTIYIKTFW